jgi:hypothetical protein
MANAWTAHKATAWAAWLTTVTMRSVAACDCASCRSIRAQCEGASIEGKPTRRGGYAARG